METVDWPTVGAVERSGRSVRSIEEMSAVVAGSGAVFVFVFVALAVVASVVGWVVASSVG